MSTFKLDTNYTVGGGYNSAALPIVTDVNSWTVYSKDGVIKMPNPTMKLGTIGMNEMGYRIIYTMINNTTGNDLWYHAGEYLCIHLAPGFPSNYGVAGVTIHGEAIPAMGTSDNGALSGGLSNRLAPNAVMLQDILIPATTKAAFWAGFEPAFIPQTVTVFGADLGGGSGTTTSTVFNPGTHILPPDVYPFCLVGGIVLINVLGPVANPTTGRPENVYDLAWSNMPANFRNAKKTHAEKLAMAVNGVLLRWFDHAA
jgi:hypothetical protein